MQDYRFFLHFGLILQRLPPLSTDPDRCERAFVGNTIGQANGVYDKPLDLRFCDYTNEKTNLKGKSLAAALMSDAKFDGADMTEVIMSKAYAVGASFKGKFTLHFCRRYSVPVFLRQLKKQKAKTKKKCKK